MPILSRVVTAGAGGSGDITISNFRVGVVPSGTKNGANRDFILPEDVVASTFRLYHNGRRLERATVESPSDGDYILQESGGVGTGFDVIHFLRFKPVARSTIQADYVAS